MDDNDDKIIYATHPLRPELKRDANAAGVRIIDAAFAPAGSRIMDGQTGQQVGADPADLPRPNAAQLTRMNKTSLLAFLAVNGVDAAETLTNAELVELALPFAEQD